MLPLFQVDLTDLTCTWIGQRPPSGKSIVGSRCCKEENKIETKDEKYESTMMRMDDVDRYRSMLYSPSVWNWVGRGRSCLREGRKPNRWPAAPTCAIKTLVIKTLVVTAVVMMKTVFVMKAMKQCELNTHDEDSLFGDSPNTVCKVECRSEMRNRNWCWFDCCADDDHADMSKHKSGRRFQIVCICSALCRTLLNLLRTKVGNVLINRTQIC